MNHTVHSEVLAHTIMMTLAFLLFILKYKVEEYNTVRIKEYTNSSAMQSVRIHRIQRLVLILYLCCYKQRI